MILGQGLGIGYGTHVGSDSPPPPPQLLTSGLVAYLDADSGLTDTGDLTQITQAVGVATFTPLGGGTGPQRDDLGWGRRSAGGTPAGFARSIQSASGTGLITTDAAVLATFGATTTDFTVLMLAWPFSSNSNWFCWGIGNAATNLSISGVMSGSTTMTLASTSVGGTGTVTLNTASIYTRTKWPTLCAWRVSAGVANLFINNFVTPKLSTAFTWTTNPNHTRFGFLCRPDLSPDLSLASAQVKWTGLYNRALAAPEMVQMGRYLGYRGNVPLGGWGINEITPAAT